jgi:hypothetical protein
MTEQFAGPAIVTHGGAGGSRSDDDGCVAAANAGLAKLDGGTALDAVVAAVVVLEDDERFNAGTGSVLCLDGHTIEMDAALMDSRGALGAVACLQRVKNPILVAREVSRTPHMLIAGEGAERFARALGIPEYYKVADKALRKHRELLAILGTDEQAHKGHDNARFAQYWNYLKPMQKAAEMGCDTVGAVVRDAGRPLRGGRLDRRLGALAAGPGRRHADHRQRLLRRPAGAVACHRHRREHRAPPAGAHASTRWIEDGMPLQHGAEARRRPVRQGHRRSA